MTRQTGIAGLTSSARERFFLRFWVKNLIKKAVLVLKKWSWS